NLMLLYDAFVDVSKTLLHILLALNHTYYSGFKWTHILVSNMRIAPPDLGPRLRHVFQAEHRVAIAELRTLVEDTYDLIEQHMPEINVERLRYLFRYSRQP